MLDWTTKRFTDAGVVGARLEAQVLLAHALGCTRMQLYTGFDRPLGEEELASARGLIKRRLGGEPLAYLVGEQEFWSRTFEVSPDVLIPRSDTETVVQAVLDRLGADKARPRRGLDLCTGSGVLAITLARELPGLTMVATDVSTAAAAVATAQRRAPPGRRAGRGAGRRPVGAGRRRGVRPDRGQPAVHPPGRAGRPRSRGAARAAAGARRRRRRPGLLPADRRRAGRAPGARRAGSPSSTATIRGRTWRRCSTRRA